MKDKKPSAKDKLSDSTTVAKKEIVSKVQTSPGTSTAGKSKAASKEKSAPSTTTTPVKKSPQKDETSAKTTPRGRNTRSKK